MLTPRKIQQGMSLIELGIGLVIVGILIAASLPSFMAWIQNTQIRTASESMLNGLQMARTEAARRNLRVVFTLGSQSDWTVGCLNVTTACPAAIQSRVSGEGSKNASVTVTPAGATQVTFNGIGFVVANSDGSASITQIDVDVPTSILPADESRNLRIAISSGGQVLMCDPSVTTTGDSRKCP